MNKIEVAILDHGATYHDNTFTFDRLMVLGARITQHSEQIKNMNDLLELYNKPFSYTLVETLSDLPHPTLQKLGVITIAVVGASRRFLSQITRHQNEVKFVSGSLQYSDMRDHVAYVVPYNMFKDADAHDDYIRACTRAYASYTYLIQNDIPHDDAAYCLPQGLRNVLIISATPYQWKHMIHQRVCRRNTDETRWVMLQCWDKLKDLCPEIFTNCGPFCMLGPCQEGKMCCGKPIDKIMSPGMIMREDYPLLFEHNDIVTYS